jgi:hypothetical protein
VRPAGRRGRSYAKRARGLQRVRAERQPRGDGRAERFVSRPSAASREEPGPRTRDGRVRGALGPGSRCARPGHERCRSPHWPEDKAKPASLGLSSPRKRGSRNPRPCGCGAIACCTLGASFAPSVITWSPPTRGRQPACGAIGSCNSRASAGEFAARR